MTPREKLEYILTMFDCFQQNVDFIIKQAKYRVREELKINNLEVMISNLSERIYELLEIYLRQEFNENGSLKNVPKLDKIVDSLSNKIHKMLKLNFDDVISKDQEQKQPPCRALEKICSRKTK